MFKIAKNDTRYHWTNHIIRKMGYYGLTPDRVKRVIRSPNRSETGVAENTVAVMQVGPNKKKPTEVWVMYQRKGLKTQGTRDKGENSKFQILNSKFILISAWRYPGVSPVGQKIPIPEDILAELKEEGVL